MAGSGAAARAFQNLPNQQGSESYERRGSIPMHHSSSSPVQNPGKPCRSCVDFRTWIASQRKGSSTSAESVTKTSTAFEQMGELPPNHTCPLDINELGRNTWGLLHTMAANYPERPTSDQQQTMKQFFDAFSKTYPCDMCAHDFRKRMKKTPVAVESQHGLSQWLCQTHNGINRMLGKPMFDCRKVNERWRDGWADGSCG